MPKTPRPKPDKRPDPPALLPVPLHSIVHFVQMIEEQAQTGAFVAAAKSAGATASLTPEAVDFVRQFLRDHTLHSALIEKVVDPCPNDPFQCHFRD